MGLKNLIYRKMDLQQEIIKEAFSDMESFKENVLNNHSELSGTDYTEGQLYAHSMVEYYNYLEYHGYKFSRTQLSIVNKCQEIKDKYFSDYSYHSPTSEDVAKRNEKLRAIVLDILKDSSTLKSFLYEELELKDTTYEKICEYVKSRNSICQYFIRNGIQIENKELLRNMHLLELYCNERKHIIDNELLFEIDSGLVDKVYGEVSQSLLHKETRTNNEQVELAYQIFNAFNRAMSYDEKMHIDNQYDLQFDSNADKEIYKAYYKSPAEINQVDNSVACRTWAYLYAELLKKAGIKAYVIHVHIHKKVMFLDENLNMYIVDGTQFQNHLSDEIGLGTFRMTDMERSKLGLHTTNFTKVSIDRKNQRIVEIYKDGIFKKPPIRAGKISKALNGTKVRIRIPFSKKEKDMFKEFYIRALENAPIDEDEFENVKHMLHVIEEARRMPTIFVNPCRNMLKNNDKAFIMKLKLINRILLSVQPYVSNDNTVIRALARNLKHWLFIDEFININEKFYIIDKKNDVKIQPILCVEDEKSEHETLYMWNQNDGFALITPEEIINKLKTGELYYYSHCDHEHFERKNDFEYEIEKQMGYDKDEISL